MSKKVAVKPYQLPVPRHSSPVTPKGFALISVLVLGFVISLIAGTTFLIVKNGLLMTGSEIRYNIAEKTADYGINYYVDGYTTNKSPFVDDNCNCSNNYCICTIKPNPNSKEPVAIVRIIYTNNVFIIHSTGIYQGAKVIKIASANTVLKTVPNTKGKAIANMGAVMMTKVANISGLGTNTNASISACDNSCTAAAIILGSQLPQGQVITESECKNSNGIASNSGSSILIKDGSNGTEPLTPDKIYSTYFNGVNNRDDLYNKFRNMYGVDFNSFGQPAGFNSTNSITIIDQLSSFPAEGSSYDVCNLGYNANVGTANASGNTITTSDGWNIWWVNCQAKPTFVWDGSKYIGTLNCYKNGIPAIKPITFYCNKIDFGWNATLNISNFTGGGGLAAGMININSGTINGSPLTLVGKNQLTMADNIIISSPVYMFALNYTIDANNLHINSPSIIASLAKGISNLNIMIRGNSNIGTQDNPTLIISDNNINLKGDENSVVNGLVFATDVNNNFNLATDGNYTINGSISSASANNNNINMHGNSKVNFDSKVIQNLSSNFSGLVNSPQCGSTVIAPVIDITNNMQKINFKTTVQTVY